MKIYVDIDGTICTQCVNYSDAEPIKEAIDKINALYDADNEIVYWTARGGTSGKDWTYVTTQQLKEWGCRYNELRFGKPDYDILFDDKAVRLNQQ